MSDTICRQLFILCLLNNTASSSGCNTNRQHGQQSQPIGKEVDTGGRVPITVQQCSLLCMARNFVTDIAIRDVKAKALLITNRQYLPGICLQEMGKPTKIMISVEPVSYRM
jgi:hypothetical protein